MARPEQSEAERRAGRGAERTWARTSPGTPPTRAPLGPLNPQSLGRLPSEVRPRRPCAPSSRSLRAPISPRVPGPFSRRLWAVLPALRALFQGSLGPLPPQVPPPGSSSPRRVSGSSRQGHRALLGGSLRPSLVSKSFRRRGWEEAYLPALLRFLPWGLRHTRGCSGHACPPKAQLVCSFPLPRRTLARRTSSISTSPVSTPDSEGARFPARLIRGLSR